MVLGNTPGSFYSTFCASGAFVRITHDWVVGKGLKHKPYKRHNVNSFIFSHITAYMAPLCMVLAPIGTLCKVLLVLKYYT